MVIMEDCCFVKNEHLQCINIFAGDLLNRPHMPSPGGKPGFSNELA